MAYRSAAPQTQFQQKAGPLATDLINALESEHIREVETLYKDQLMYRAELDRVVKVMQSDMIPREKQLHDLLDKVNASYAAATKDLHAKMAGQVGDISNRKNQGKEKLLDPLQDMENELRRMTSLLQKPMADQRDLSPDQKRQIEQQVKTQQQNDLRRTPPRAAMPMATMGRVFLCEQEQIPSQMFSRSPSNLSSQKDFSPDWKDQMEQQVRGVPSSLSSQKDFSPDWKDQMEQQVSMPSQKDLSRLRDMAAARVGVPSALPAMDNVFLGEQDVSPSQRLSNEILSPSQRFPLDPSAGNIVSPSQRFSPDLSTGSAGNLARIQRPSEMGMFAGEQEQSPTQRFAQNPSAGSLVYSQQRITPREISMFAGNGPNVTEGNGPNRNIPQQGPMGRGPCQDDGAHQLFDRRLF